MKLMRYTLYVLLLMAFCPGKAAMAQKKILKKFFSDDRDSTRSSSFLPLPAIGYSQETGFEFGAVTLYSFYTDRNDTLTRNSSISGVATFTTKSQSNFQLRADIWKPQNKYHQIAELKYKNFPFSYYGTGSRTREADQSRITQKLIRVAAEIEKKMGRQAYTGLNASFENYRFTNQSAAVALNNNPLIGGWNGGKVLFIGLSQIIDSRNSNTYSTRGTSVKLNYSYAPDIFGGDNFSGSLTKLDFRTFKSLSAKTTLGLNANYQSLQGKNTPFYLLPQLGNDNMMRGYYSGRYRDKNLLAAQAELRYRFNPRLGVVGFMGAGTVYGTTGNVFDEIKPSYGGGFRYFFDVDRGLSVRVDYGVGEKRPGEKRQTGMYISLGEAF